MSGANWGAIEAQQARLGGNERLFDGVLAHEDLGESHLLDNYRLHATTPVSWDGTHLKKQCATK